MGYGDTFLLCIKKRPTIFLHLYHHITVTLYCLHAYINHVTYGHIFTFVNLNIHAVMYCYYALAIMEQTKSHRWVRAVRPYITSMQLAQMFLGMGIAYTEIVWPNPAIEMTTALYRDKWLALVMYTSYAYLFGDFWIKNYTNYAPVRTLLGCTPMTVLCLSLPLCLIDGLFSVVSWNLAKLILVTLVVCKGLVSLGADRRLTVQSILNPMAATADDFSTSVKVEGNKDKTPAIFAKGQSTCIDIIRYSTVPLCFITLGCDFSPICLWPVNFPVAMFYVSLIWCVLGYNRGCFRSAECHKQVKVQVSSLDNENNQENDKENITTCKDANAAVQPQRATNLVGA